MSKQTYRSMDQHISLLGWLYIAMHIILVLVAVMLFVGVVAGGLFSGDAEALAVTSLVGALISGFFVALAAPGVLAGFGLLKRKSWARPLAMVLGILNLMSFPFGTAVGVYTLWVLMQEDAADLFISAKMA